MKRLDPAAMRGSIFNIRIIAGSLMLPKINPTAPPSTPMDRPKLVSTAILLFLKLL